MASSYKSFLGKSWLATFTTKVLLKNFIERALFFNYAISLSHVQTDITVNYYFYFCFYSFEWKNKLLHYAKTSLVALKGRKEPIFHIINEIS